MARDDLVTRGPALLRVNDDHSPDEVRCQSDEWIEQRVEWLRGFADLNDSQEWWEVAASVLCRGSLENDGMVVDAQLLASALFKLAAVERD